MFETFNLLHLSYKATCSVFFLIAARFYGAMAIFPLFSDGLLPKMLKVLLAASFALIVLPLYLNVEFNDSVFNLGILLFKEFLVGTLIGYIFSIPTWMVENVGNIIDIQRGEQFGAEVDPMTKNPTSSISKLLNQTFVVYFVTAGGISLFVKFILVSFVTWSPVEYLYKPHVLKVSMELFANYFYWVVILTLPIIFILFVVDLVLGLFSSFIQQLNVTILSMPLKGLVALLVMIFYIGFICHFTLGKFFNAEMFSYFTL